MGENGAMCPVFRPTREEFEQPFCDYVRKVFRKHPDLPMFKVVPPRGWKPRRTPFPDLRKVQINVPIRQHVFGTKGAYRCVFVEQKPMSVAEFKVAAEEEASRLRGCSTAHATGSGDGLASSGVRVSSRIRHNRAPQDYESGPAAQQRAVAGGDGDAGAETGGTGTGGVDLDAVDPDMERAFWSNVTLNPPMYGADTPTSFFDEKVQYGWNLQHLGDLLQNHPEVDSVPGVTTPMTYFGMWRSFFGWHKEDADLYSINFLHWGAPKVWYGVPPSAKYKFERMAQSLFPELHRACPAFVRHKDIMLSPSCLKTYGVPCMRACQRPNEFVVLNAAAYHAGFNSGFNCAEAVNFGMKEWIPVGKEAVPCRCHALKDGVRISMKLFDPKWVDPYETPSESPSVEESDSKGGSEEEEEKEKGANKRRRGGGRAAAPAAKKPRGRKVTTAAIKKKKTTPATKKGRKAAAAESSDEEASDSSDEERSVEEVVEKASQSTKPQRKRTLTKKAAAVAAEKAEAAAEARGRAPRAAAAAAAPLTSGRDKRASAAAAAAVVKKAIAKSRGVTGAVKSKAASTTKAAVPKQGKATAPKPAAETARRGPGRPRKAAADSSTVGAATAGRAGAGRIESRKRKAEEQPEKATIDAPAEAGADQPEGRGSRPRRAAAAAAAAVTAAAAASGARKRARGSSAGEAPVAVKDDAGVNGVGADGINEAVAAGTRAAAGRRARASLAQTGGATAGEAKDGGRCRGGRSNDRSAVTATATAAAVMPLVTDTAAAEPPAAPAPAPAPPVLTVETSPIEVNTDGRLVVTAVKPRSTVEAAAMALKARTNTPCQEPVLGPPMAIVGDADGLPGRRLISSTTATDRRFFFLVQRLARPASTPGNVLLRWLKEGRDGLFRPVAGSVWEEPAGALLPVRALAVSADKGTVIAAEGESEDDVSGSSSPPHSAAGEFASETPCEPEAWRLVTPREQIVDVELRRE